MKCFKIICGVDVGGGSMIDTFMNNFTKFSINFRYFKKGIIHTFYLVERNHNTINKIIQE